MSAAQSVERQEWRVVGEHSVSPNSIVTMIKFKMCSTVQGARDPRLPLPYVDRSVM